MRDEPVPPNGAPPPGRKTLETEHYRKQLEAVCDNATLALIIMDERQQCVYMNRAAEKLTGYTLAELQGHTLHDTIHHTRPDGRPYPLEECPIGRAFPQNNQEQGEEVFVHKNGTFYPVAYTASPLREAETVVGTIIEIRDIGRDKQAEAALAAEARRLETLNRVGAALAAELDLEKLVQAVTDAGVALSGAEFGAFFYNVLNESGESYMLYTLSGVPREAFATFPMPRNTAVFGPTFRGEGVVRSDDITKDPRYGRNAPHHGMPKGHLPVCSYLAVPVVSRSGEVLGGLFFGHSKPGIFSEGIEQLMTGIAGQAAIAIDNARLYADAQREITERRRAQERLALLLAEKEEMLKEIHHRVKNNLQVVLSLLGLEAGKITDRHARDRLQMLRDRVGVIARVHEQLYASDDFARIDFGEHLERMVANLQALYDGAADATITVKAEKLFCNLETAVPLGLVANELITNSLKHAFPAGRRGTVRVALRRQPAGDRVELVVADDGIGMGRIVMDGVGTGGAAGLADAGLGKTLVAALIQQIGAELSIDDRAGTRTTISMADEDFRPGRPRRRKQSAR